MPSTTPTGCRIEKARLPGTSEGMVSPGNLRSHGRSFAQHLRSEINVKPGPARGRTDLIHHDADEVWGARLEQVGRAQKFLATLGRAQRRPGRKSCGGGRCSGPSIVYSGGSRARGHAAGNWVGAVERRRIRGGGIAISDKQLHFGHGNLLRSYDAPADHSSLRRQRKKATVTSQSQIEEYRFVRSLQNNVPFERSRVTANSPCNQS